MKYILLLIVGVLAICSYILIANYNSAEQELTKVHKEKYLCDKNVPNSSNCDKTTTPSMPKGVCAPGGKCS
jgi:hypothetical protein